MFGHFDCQKSFDKLKVILKSAPVLLGPSFDEEFKLTFLKSLSNIIEITLP